jgi:hypothetical protein
MVAIGTPGDTIGFRGSNESMVLHRDTGAAFGGEQNASELLSL